MFPIIDIGPIALQSAGLILLFSLFLGIWLTGKFSEELGTNGNVIENSFLIGLIAGILGARIGFLLQNPSVFLENPFSLVSLTPSMLNADFGVLVGGLAAFIAAQKNHLPFWPTMDALTPMILLIFTGIHLSNFANGNHFGLPTGFSWGIRLWNAVRHPVQLYAVILTVGLLIWLINHTKVLRTTGFMRSGILFKVILAGLGFITIFTRAFVAQKMLFAGLDVIQLMAFFVVTAALSGVYFHAYQPRGNIKVLIGIGSNITPGKNLQNAVQRISKTYKLKRSSSTYQTEAVKGQGAESFYLNQVIEIETQCSFPVLAAKLKSIEHDFGREPGNKIQVPLDLDILTYNNDVFTHKGKQIPDPDLVKFGYIAIPLAEMDPDFRHPADGQSIQTILESLQDKSQVLKHKEVENGVEE